jgi:hypothetical protein
MSNMAHFSAVISGSPGRAAVTRGDQPTFFSLSVRTVEDD